MKKALVAVVILIGSLLPMGSAIAEPKVLFINPSGYTSLKVLSDKEDVGTSYHLVAWVREVPSSPIVEFELDPPAGVGGNPITVTATRVGTDTWEHDFEIPETLPDGDGYTLRAILYQGQDQIAVDEQLVRINQAAVPPPDADNTVEITDPPNGGQLGFFQPAGGKPSSVIDVTASEGTRQVRAFYTSTAPGAAADWKLCGSARVTELRAKVRCTVDGVGVAAVTAVAAVANNTPPPGAPNMVADASGDAHRISPYEQIVSSVDVTPDSKSVPVEECFTLTSTAIDQLGDEVANVNIDVHATGPDDQLQFGTLFDQTGQLQESDKFQAPDKGAHSTDDAINCSEKNSLNKQGDHNRPGLPDFKHIESVDNTNNSGQFGFVLYSAVKGGTQITAWADVNNDDLQGSSEAAGGAALGWGQEPPPPQRQVFLEPETAQAGTGDCQRMVISAKEGSRSLSGANVDMHASGPDSAVEFCEPGDAGAGRTPDSGGHVEGRDSDGSAHQEGETDSSGQFIFGVVSNSEGATNVTVWLDESDEDTLNSGEPQARAQIAWGGEVRRVSTNLTISHGNGSFKGKARSSDNGCRRGRQVTIKKVKRGRDPVVGSDTTNRKGAYTVRSRANGRFYAQAAGKTYVSGDGDTIKCRSDKSRTIRP